ncbi:MAG TPA: DUF418 domain-containing protein [Bryobacteraceae bacterium]|nr:DUF418 domain-containing protein [Bryobacteraceae bacterium]
MVLCFDDRIMNPVSARDRISAIDILRGAALFGILAANMRGLAGPRAVYFDPDALWNAPWDRITSGLNFLLVQQKFITIFSVLFGLGFAIQMSRAMERGGGLWFYARRLAILALFGVAHAWVVWWGDILFDYAVTGLLLFVFFRKCRPKTVAIWATLLLSVEMVMPLGFWAWSRLRPAAAPAAQSSRQPGRQSAPQQPPSAAERQRRIQREIRMQTGSYPEIVRSNFEIWRRSHRNPVLYVVLLPLFLSGLWLWRSGFIPNLPAYIPTLGRVWKGALALALPLIGFIVYVETAVKPPRNQPTLAGGLEGSAMMLLALSLAATYGALLLAGAQSPRWQPRLAPFGAVGRMALTNYLLQSVLLTWAFRLTGLYAQPWFGPLLLLVPTILFFAMQVWASNWWLERYQFGPLEWLWRSLTYGHKQPLRRITEAPHRDEAAAAEA